MLNETKAFDEPPHRGVFSLGSDPHADLPHATIKAVCTAVCSDVRLLEKTTFTPGRGSRGSGTSTSSDRTREARAECRQRAVVAGARTFAAEMYRPPRNAGRRSENPSKKCPAAWPRRSGSRGAEH